MDIKKISESKLVRGILIGIGICIIAIFIFQAGMNVGYRKAAFSFKFGDNYYRTFVGQGGGMEGRPFKIFLGEDIAGGHGITGKVLKVNLPSIIIEGADNIEKVITVDNNTVIKRFRETVPSSEIKTNDMLVVLGEPDENGQIRAKLVRFLPPFPPQMMPLSSSTNEIR